MKTILSSIIGIVFPSNCLNCGIPVSIFERNICKTCFNSIKFIEKKCGRCSGIIQDGECTICPQRAFYPEKNISITEYSGVIKEMIHNFKFNGKKGLSGLLADIAINEMLNQNFKPDIITSVPMSRKKLWERGYNQSYLVSKEMAKKLKFKYCEILSEKKIPTSQKNLGYRDRFINVLNRYKVINEKHVTGKSILLVDDVFTTGATINECARILLNAGALKVFSLTLTRTNIKKA